MRTPRWLILAIIVPVLWGVWGALIEFPEKLVNPPFPSTLGYAVWSLTMVLLSLFALATPPASRDDAVPASAEVKIDNFSFGPETLTVPAGTTVTWTNRDDIPHTVTSSDDPRVFKSKVLDTDEKFSFTFTKAGTYPYFCSIHPKMTAKVIVQ